MHNTFDIGCVHGGCNIATVRPMLVWYKHTLVDKLHDISMCFSPHLWTLHGIPKQFGIIISCCRSWSINWWLCCFCIVQFVSTLVLGCFIVYRLLVSYLCLESNPPITPSIRPAFAVCAQRLRALITSGCSITASRFVLVLIFRQ